MKRSIEEIEKSYDYLFVTLQRWNCDLTWRLKNLPVFYHKQAIEAFSNQIERYLRVIIFLDTTLKNIEYALWFDQVEQEIEELTK